jgi:hypothetical protein
MIGCANMSKKVYYPDTISILLCSHHFPVLVILRSIVHVMLSASTFLLFSPSFPYDIPCRRAFGINHYRRSGGSGRVVVYSCRSRNESKPTARGAAGWEAGGVIRAGALRLERSNLFHVRLVLMFSQVHYSVYWFNTVAIFRSHTDTTWRSWHNLFLDFGFAIFVSSAIVAITWLSRFWCRGRPHCGFVLFPPNSHA